MTARMTRARALYLAVYESQGGQWEANDCKELWCDMADRYLELCGSVAQAPANPIAWVLPGDDTARDGGWIDARIDEWGEFTKPLYAAPQPPAQAAPGHLIERLEKYELRLLMGDQHDREMANDIGRAAHFLTLAVPAQAPPDGFVSVELLNIERSVCDDLRERNAKLRASAQQPLNREAVANAIINNMPRLNGLNAAVDAIMALALPSTHQPRDRQMILDPVTGPMTREEFKEIVAAPYGAARKAIRKYDPFWGLAKGEKITFKVEVSATRMSGTAYVTAATQKEADELADAITESDVDWDYDNDIEVISVEPYVAIKGKPVDQADIALLTPASHNTEAG